ncbi:hypothetical protein, partial [Mesorhizobium sp. WSM3224]|uniref:hypothetical protein n=1 Tax=Mesorhizobium sp. WSM3224 TaxID=1040986 RepID=UPI001AEC61BC
MAGSAAGPRSFLSRSQSTRQPVCVLKSGGLEVSFVGKQRPSKMDKLTARRELLDEIEVNGVG